MTLTQLSEQYRESGKKCRDRADELRITLETVPMSETERLLLRRRIYILETMARQTTATAKYLRYYYGEPQNG